MTTTTPEGALRDAARLLATDRHDVPRCPSPAYWVWERGQRARQNYVRSRARALREQALAAGLPLPTDEATPAEWADWRQRHAAGLLAVSADLGVSCQLDLGVILSLCDWAELLGAWPTHTPPCLLGEGEEEIL